MAPPSTVRARLLASWNWDDASSIAAGRCDHARVSEDAGKQATMRSPMTTGGERLHGGQCALLSSAGMRSKGRGNVRSRSKPSSPTTSKSALFVVFLSQLAHALLVAIDWLSWHTVSLRVDWIPVAWLAVRRFFRPDPVLPWSDAALLHHLKRHRFGAVTATVVVTDAVQCPDVDDRFAVDVVGQDVTHIGHNPGEREAHMRIVRGCRCARCHARMYVFPMLMRKCSHDNDNMGWSW